MRPTDDPADAPELLALLPGYAELHCQSNFSFLQGASHPEELAARAELGYAALAITDECSGRRGARAHGGKEAQPAAAHRRLLPAARRADAAPLGLTLLAQTREGYGNLSELITLARSRAASTGWRPRTSPIRRPAARTCAACPNAWPS